MNIQEKLNQIVQELKQNNIEEPNLKAKIIIAHTLKIKKEQLLIQNKRKLTEEELKQINENNTKLIQGKPIQYITNSQEFMGLNFYVNEDVLIPQPDTEILVEETIKLIKKYKLNNVGVDHLDDPSKTTYQSMSNNIKILDLCTGSGCIAISIAKLMSNIVGNDAISPQIIATDISEKALKIAKTNAKNNNVENKIKFIKSDMFKNINEKFDVILSNPPYIETNTIKTLSKEVQNEPKLALDGGKDGLNFYRIIAKNAHKHLNKNGIIMLEIGYNQRKAVTQIFEETKKYKNIECKKDYSNNDRIIICYY